jgi:hypothetical protein
MKYELWHSRDGRAGIYTLVTVGSSRGENALEADARLIRTFEAETWEDACRQKHEYLGWESYKPMTES